jgi:hypothetical protein
MDRGASYTPPGSGARRPPPQSPPNYPPRAYTPPNYAQPAHEVAARTIPRAGTSGAGSTRKRKYLIVGGGALVALVCVVFIVASTFGGVKCPGNVKLKAPKPGATVNGAFALGLDVENRRCISSVSYQIDGEEVASESIFPYEVMLNAQALAEKLPAQDTHELTVSIEDTRGETINLREKRSFSFAATVKAATANAEPSPDASPTASPAPTVETRKEDLRASCDQLASQISRKSGYIFTPEFTSLVEQRIGEYNTVPASDLARRYRREVNKAFGDMGIEPLVGYVLAFSRSKLNPEATTAGGVGLWQIPPGVARTSGYLAPTDTEAALKDPKRSAEIAALYWKQLQDAFGRDDFMYAIACYGMSVNEAGLVSAKLNGVADPEARRDVMKMLKAGVLDQSQVDRVARFYAAGIVGEQRAAQHFSSLY